MMKSCYDYALEYISRYPKTEKELRIKLYQKWRSSEEVDSAIALLKKQKYVDDAMFARMYIRSDVINKGKPSLVLRKKLEMRGIDRNILDEVFRDNQDEMQEWIESRIKKDIAQYKKKDVDGFDIIQKLMRKWYKLDDIKRVIQNK